MIDAKEALEKVLNNVGAPRIEPVALTNAIGRILAKSVHADRDLPPFDRVCMDGIALNHDAWAEGQRNFKISGTVAAGQVRQELKSKLECLEIMTGAPLPINTDTVIRYEDISIDRGIATIQIENIIKGANIHLQGSDKAKGSLLLKANLPIKSADINVLATVGLNEVEVLSKPRVAVISSGEELVDVNETPLPHQIRKSNVYMIMARLREKGIEANSLHFKDSVADIKSKIIDCMESHDVLIMSGGVSKGKFDFIPRVLADIGFEQLFHGVKQRPGKPFWFGKREETVVFAFPGNPVSSLACFHYYFIPWLAKYENQPAQNWKVKLKKSVIFTPDLTYYAQASISQSADGILEATISHGNGSGDLVSPSRQDGFVVLPRGKETYSAGEVFTFIPFHPIIA